MLGSLIVLLVVLCHGASASTPIKEDVLTLENPAQNKKLHVHTFSSPSPFTTKPPILLGCYNSDGTQKEKCRSLAKKLAEKDYPTFVIMHSTFIGNDEDPELILAREILLASCLLDSKSFFYVAYNNVVKVGHYLAKDFPEYVLGVMLLKFLPDNKHLVFHKTTKYKGYSSKRKKECHALKTTLTSFNPQNKNQRATS